MVMIVNPVLYPTKKSLKEALEKGNLIQIEDPSIINPRIFMHSEMQNGERIVVTNHPKRSYFVTIERRVDGTFKVV